VIDFVRDLFKAAVRHTPGPFFSTGGDEINALCYSTDDIVQGTLNKTGQTFEQALDNFTQKTHAMLLESGKTPVVWQEMVLNHKVKLDPKTVVL
jgi:hexosaminidase